MRTKIAAFLLLIGFLMATPRTSEGFDFSIGDNVNGTIKGDLTYTARLRTEYPDWKLENLSSGDSNFSKGELVNNKVISRVELQTYAGEHLSFFGRGEIFFDEVFADTDDYKGEIRKHAEYNFTDPLEYYLEGKFGDFTVRAGRQIVQWGESLAPVFAVAVNTVSPFFGAKIAAAGYTFRDYQIPSHMIWANYEFLGTWSVEAIWAPDFDPRYSMPVVGTYGSFTDGLGFGQDGSVDDRRPKKFADQQQGGVALRKIFPSLKNFELGLYYFHHLDRSPSISADLAGLLTGQRPVASYEEIDMYGMSFSHVIEQLGLDLQIQGELAYRPNDTLQRNLIIDSPGLALALGADVGDSLGPLGGFDEGKTLNWVFGGSKLFSDCLSFTPWTFALFAIYEFYGGINLDVARFYEQDKNYSDPKHTGYYFLSLPLSVADLVPKTTLTTTFEATGSLHKEQNSLHRFSFSLKAKYGDSLEALVGYDYLVGEADQQYAGDVPLTRSIGPNNTSDRDALTFKFTWYFI